MDKLVKKLMSNPDIVEPSEIPYMHVVQNYAFLFQSLGNHWKTFPQQRRENRRQ
jgi:hypothetical protein